MAQQIELTERPDELSQRLQSYVQSGNLNFLLGSGASVPAINTVGSIEKEINELIVAGKQDDADIRSLEFVEKLSAEHGALHAKTHSAEFSATLAGYVDFVRAIDAILFQRKNDLLPRQANVFTTNYDMFVELAAGRIPALVLNDGFSRAAAMDTKFSFAPERYTDRTYRSGSIYNHPSEIPTVNLIKLHGSLSWRRDGDSIVYDTTPVGALPQADRTNSAKVQEHIEKFFLILPNIWKFHATIMERVYYDLLRIYANALQLENALVICFGFSFEDEHILDITRRALRNPTAQLIIFSYSHDDASRFISKFENQRNVLVIAPRHGEHIDFARLNELLRTIIPK